MSSNPLDQPDSDQNDKFPGSEASQEPTPPEPTPPEPASPELSPKDKFRQIVESRRVDDDEDREDDLWKGGYSQKAMFGNWVLAAVITIGGLVAVLMIDWRSGGLWITWLCVALLLWVGFGLLYLYRRLTVKYELTSQRFIHESGLLKRLTDRIEVIDIDDVAFEQGPVERIVGVGTIKITSSDRSHPELSLRGIGNVKSVAGLLDDVRRKERRRRGLHIESI